MSNRLDGKVCIVAGAGWNGIGAFGAGALSIDSRRKTGAGRLKICHGVLARRPRLRPAGSSIQEVAFEDAVGALPSTPCE